MTNAKCRNCRLKPEQIQLGHRVWIICWGCMTFTFLHETTLEAKKEWRYLNENKIQSQTLDAD